MKHLNCRQKAKTTLIIYLPLKCTMLLEAWYRLFISRMQFFYKRKELHIEPLYKGVGQKCDWTIVSYHIFLLLCIFLLFLNYVHNFIISVFIKKCLNTIPIPGLKKGVDSALFLHQCFHIHKISKIRTSLRKIKLLL